jgi:phenylacetate-CoA ligase
MSSYHLAPDLLPYYFDALKHFRISYVFGYTSSLYAIADEALQKDRNDLQMIVAITNAEPVFDYQRRTIAEAFQCSVRETYGMAEIVAAASECTLGKLHLWPEVGWVEFFNSIQSTATDVSGDLVCTSLLNADMPLIRYRVGDTGVLPVLGDVCSCGRTLPVLASIEGRADDMLYTSDGRRIGRLDSVFKAQLPLREAQIIQEALDRIRVRYVPTANFTPVVARSLIRRLQERLGRVEVLLERVDEVPREKNGKFRAVICNLPAAEREELHQTGQ